MKTKDQQEQCYSRYNGTYCSYKYMMDDLKECGYNIGESVQVWEADKKEWKHSDFINLLGILQGMQSAAMDECGEVAEEYLNDITNTQADDLQKYLTDWFDKNSKLNFYGVENERKIVVIVE